MNDEMNTEDFLQLRKDVKDIKNALLGSDTYGQKGIVQRLSDVEREVDQLKDFKSKIVYWTAGAAALATGIVNVILIFF